MCVFLMNPRTDGVPVVNTFEGLEVEPDIHEGVANSVMTEATGKGSLRFRSGGTICVFFPHGFYLLIVSWLYWFCTFNFGVEDVEHGEGVAVDDGLESEVPVDPGNIFSPCSWMCRHTVHTHTFVMLCVLFFCVALHCMVCSGSCPWGAGYDDESWIIPTAKAIQGYPCCGRLGLPESLPPLV